MTPAAPWRKRGLRVHRFVYRAWYIGQLLLGGFILVVALAPVLLMAFDAGSLDRILTASAAAATGLVGAFLLWLAIHRLRDPVRPAQ